MHPIKMYIFILYLREGDKESEKEKDKKHVAINAQGHTVIVAGPRRPHKAWQERVLHDSRGNNRGLITCQRLYQKCRFTVAAQMLAQMAQNRSQSRRQGHTSPKDIRRQIVREKKGRFEGSCVGEHPP